MVADRFGCEVALLVMASAPGLVLDGGILSGLEQIWIEVRCEWTLEGAEMNVGWSWKRRHEG